MPSAAALRAGRAVIELTLLSKGVTQGLRRVQEQAKKTSASFTKIGTFGISTGGFAGLRNLFLGSTAVAAATWPIKFAANLEIATAQLSTFTSSEQMARDMLLDLQKFSAVSLVPFEELAKSSAMLLRFGVAEEQVGVHTKALAVLAAGNADEFDKLSLAFAQVASAGRLQGEEMRQFKNTAFNPIREIAERTGESMDEVRTRMEAGAVSFQEVANVLQAATGPGGRFAGMLERISNTLRGQFSKAMAQLKLAVLPIGESVLKPLTDFMKRINQIIPRIGVFIKNNVSWFASFMKVSAAVAGAAVAFVTLGITLGIMSIALGGFAAILQAAFFIFLAFVPIILAVVVAAKGLGTTFDAIKGSVISALQSIMGTLKQVWAIAKQTFTGITNALAAGELKLATEIAWAGMVAAWRVGTEKIREVWTRFKFEFARIMMALKFELQRQWLDFTFWIVRQFLKALDLIANSSIGMKLFPDLKGEMTNLTIGIAEAFLKEKQQIDAEALGVNAAIDIAKGFGLRQIAKDSATATDELTKLTDQAELLAAVMREEALDLGLGKQFPGGPLAGIKKAKGIEMRKPEAFLDTRLLAQSLGANLEQEQLVELRRIRKAAENAGPMQIPVI